MKKALLFVLFAMLLTACTGYNDSEYITEGNRGYELSSDHREAMIKDYFWDGDESHTVIDIPEELSDGTPVKKLGGFIGIGVPTNFEIKYDPAVDYVNLSTLNIINEETDSPEPVSAAAADTDITPGKEDAVAVYKDIVFTVNVSKNIAKMGNMSTYNICYQISSRGIRQDDGTVLVYRPTLRFNVAPLNTNFYAEDGVLYNRSTGEAVLRDDY